MPPVSPTVRTWIDVPNFFDDGLVAFAEALLARTHVDDARLDGLETVGPRLAELGYFGVVAPGRPSGDHGVPHVAAGGRGARVSVRALCLAREVLAYVSPMADSVFAVQGLGSYAVLATDSVHDREAFLAKVATGASIGGFALTEPEAGSDVASMRTTARAEGDAWVLDGEKVFISNVGIAHHFVVFANADPSLGKKGISAFLVPAKTEGLFLQPMRAGGDHPIGRMVFKGARVAKSALIGNVGDGLRLGLGTLDVYRTSVGAAAVGMAQRALDESLRRVTTRVQFGKPLAEFQLTQAALADMATELAAARLLVTRAAWKKDHGTALPEDVAMAKMYATEAAQRIIDRAVQLHGGLGVTEGFVTERLYRDVRALRIYEGTTEIQKLIIGGALTKPKPAS
ncbi:MAG: acyl-CoA dehydrogenase family protein [Polyangiaceae bacterium]